MRTGRCPESFWGMVASSLEALRALLGGRAGALDSTVSVIVIDDMLVSMSVGCGAGKPSRSLGAWGKLDVYANLFVWSCPSRVWMPGTNSTAYQWLLEKLHQLRQ